jgi:hypothetical protein
MTEAEIVQSGRVRQGDIYRDIRYLESVTEAAGEIAVSSIVFPWVVILSQECDLDQDMKCRLQDVPPANQDKYLLTVLVAPLYVAEHVFEGSHWDLLGCKMQSIQQSGKTKKNLIKENQIPRYHFLEFSKELTLAESVVDFKHYFAVSTESLNGYRTAAHYVCSLKSLYRERLTQRFADFLARIGLPDFGS